MTTEGELSLEVAPTSKERLVPPAFRPTRGFNITNLVKTNNLLVMPSNHGPSKNLPDWDIGQFHLYVQQKIIYQSSHYSTLLIATPPRKKYPSYRGMHKAQLNTWVQTGQSFEVDGVCTIYLVCVPLHLHECKVGIIKGAAAFHQTYFGTFPYLYYHWWLWLT